MKLLSPEHGKAERFLAQQLPWGIYTDQNDLQEGQTQNQLRAM